MTDVTADQDQPAGDQSAARQSGFYVSIQRTSRNSTDTGLLLGPYDSKEEAGTHVPEGRALAESVDDRAVWDAFGVSRVTSPPDEPLPGGVLNALAEAGLPEPVVTAYRHHTPATSPIPADCGADSPRAEMRQDLGRDMEL